MPIFLSVFHWNLLVYIDVYEMLVDSSFSNSLVYFLFDLHVDKYDIVGSPPEASFRHELQYLCYVVSYLCISSDKWVVHSCVYTHLSFL